MVINFRNYYTCVLGIFYNTMYMANLTYVKWLQALAVVYTIVNETCVESFEGFLALTQSWL